MSHATVLKEWPDYYATIECTLNMFLFLDVVYCIGISSVHF